MNYSDEIDLESFLVQIRGYVKKQNSFKESYFRMGVNLYITYAGTC